MEKAVAQIKNKTPEEKIWIGIIQQAFEDAFNLSGSTNIYQADVDKARNWFYAKDCSDACEHAGTTKEFILKLYNKLNDKYKTGQIDQSQLRFAIRRIHLKI